MSHFTTKRVGLLLGQDLGYCRRVLSGVLSHAEKRGLRWIYHDAAPDSRVLPLLREWKPHGIIVHLADRRLARQLLALKVPLVSTTLTLEGIPVPTVDVNHRETGAAAARYFLGLGYRSFGYYGSGSVLFSLQRREGFARALEAAGYTLSSCHANFLPQSPLTEAWSDLTKAASAWLRRLPKPVAILASNDIPGRALCHVCRRAGIRVPQEVAILGVDNDDSECRMSFPPLSSIETPAVQVGQEAARLLGMMMENPRLRPGNIEFPPSMVMARESTEITASLDSRLEKALRFIRERAGEDLDVEKVCAAMKMSRRSAERLFREKLGSSILDQIQAARVAYAKKLLLETELGISEIAAHSGFGGQRRLNRVFVALENTTPSAFRRVAAGR